MSQPPSRLPDTAAYRALKAREKVMLFQRVLHHPRETVARYIGQIDMLNSVAGNPRPEYSFFPSKTGGSVTRAVAAKGGMRLLYDELPYEWSQPFWGRAEIFMDSGPLAHIDLYYYLEEIPEGTMLHFYGRRVSNGLGIMGWLIGWQFMKAMERASAVLEEKSAALDEDPLGISPYRDTVKDSGVDVADLNRRFEALHANPEVIGAAVDFVAHAPDKFIHRLRPLQMAAQYKLPERDTIEFFLRATRAGLFNLSWDLLCPNCRGDKARYGSLSQLENEAHCDYCNIDYGTDFAQNVELTFRPVASVRAVYGGSFCINSPGNTAFIRAQFNVWPDEHRISETYFPETNYRLRSPQFSGVRDVVISDDAPAQVILNVRAELDGPADRAPLQLPRSGRVELVNDTNELVTVKFYRDAYRDHALTAARVTSMQEFRNQFGSEALAPGFHISVENLCFLFTDLKDSTPMYEKMGDAPAFALVRDHFTILIDEVRKHNGAVVKTIGDAVMAVFTDNADAVRAAIGIQQRMHREHPSASVKIGLHAGPCMAVNSNDKLDYFGTTVNRAARIQGQAGGLEIVMTRELETAGGLAAPTGFIREDFQSTLRGIEGEMALVRWRLATPIVPAA